jgi:hypothetical protein
MSRLLKNVPAYRQAGIWGVPARSRSRGRGKRSLFTCRDATPHPSPYQARGRLVGANICRGRFQTVPYKGLPV